MENKYQAVIIGGGPAGVSAALYLARANIKTAIVENGPGALARAHKIENFYGIAASGLKLYAEGLEQARSLGVDIIQDEVLAVEYYDSFVLTLKHQAEPLPAPALILATGTKNVTLNLPGLVELEGKGISYCAVCDGFFFRKKKLAVLGHGAFALHEAEYLRHLADAVTVLTNGQDDSAAKAAGFATITTPVTAVTGSERLQAVRFADGSELEVSGLFIALGTADSTDMARKLGAQLDGRFIKVDADGATNIPGLFAAGDCIGGLKQVAKAVHDGARAGLATIKFLRKQ
ncbi:MAG: NAD(P)/FAD-dependent oxidoreductase [Phascolarctobacterium sp.]|nr:NAD(P)/FAD-dependent oxidoreductase [Phascolarctobacterium sp.]